MIFIYILLIVAGALPLIVFLIKRKNYQAILRNGTAASAVVTDKRLIRFNRGITIERVSFAYLPKEAIQYFTGQLTTAVGKYKKGEQLVVFYLSENPKKCAVPGSKGEIVFLIFTILILLLVIFACFKIHETLEVGNRTYQFKPPWTK